MKKFIIGFILGSLLSGISVYAALPTTASGREYNKFVEDGSGNVAIRAVLVQE